MLKVREKKTVVYDKDRPEGTYVTSEVYPPEGGPFSTHIYTIQRVNGDTSVDEITCSEEEAKNIVTLLRDQVEQNEKQREVKGPNSPKTDPEV